jgi:hypothetical protein
MVTSTFKWGEAEVTVRRAKVRDRLAVDAVQGKLAKGGEMDAIIASRSFGKILAQSTVKGDVGFPLLNPTADESELREAYEQWLDADAELMDIWQKHLRDVDAPLMVEEQPKAGGANPKG